MMNLLQPAMTTCRNAALASIAILLLPGCTPSSDPVTPQSASLTPGQFITLSDPSITAGVPVSIEFSSPHGFSTVVEAYNTEDGSVRVAIPPCMDATGTAFTAGEMTVGVKGSISLMTLTVTDLPPPETGDPPGAMLRVVLEAALESYQYALAGAAAVQADVGGELDSSTYTAAIAQQIAMLQSMLAEYDAAGQITISDATGSRTLTPEQMIVADRLLIAVFTGMADEMVDAASTTAAGKDARAWRKGGPAPSQGFNGQAAVAQVRNSIRTGTGAANLLVSGVGVVLCIGGLAITSPGVILVGAVVGAIGAATAYADGLAGGENSDAFLLRDPKRFNSSLEAGSQIVRYGSNAASVIPGPLGTAANVVGTGTAGWDFYKSASGLKCQGRKSSRPPNKGAPMAELDDSVDVELFCQYVSTPVEEPVEEPDADGDGGGYSPPECPAPQNGQFANRTDSVGRYYEYWISPYDSSKQVGPFRTWYSIAGVLAEQGCRNADGQVDGVWQKWRADGSLEYESNYENGSLSGWSRLYYTNGRVRSEVIYVPVGPQSMRDGVERYYYDTGQIASETTYILGVKTGPYRSWYLGGQLESDGTYVNDLPDGMWVRYTANGEIESECSYSSGTQLWCN